MMTLSKMEALPIELLKKRAATLEAKQETNTYNFNILDEAFKDGKRNPKARRMIKDRMVEISERSHEVSGELVKLSFIIEKRSK